MTKRAYEDLERELKELYSHVASPPGGLAPGRDQMLAEGAHLRAQRIRRPLSTAKRPKSEKTERRRKMNLLLAYKVLCAVMALFVAIAGAGGSVVLAADSLPGDILYPVKLSVEDARLTLVANPANSAELAMDFVAERVREMEQLVNQGELVPDHVVARMTRQMEQTIVQTAQAGPDEVPALLQRVMERIQTQVQVLERVRTVAHEESQAALARAYQVMTRARNVVAQGLAEPQRFREEYRYRHEGMLGQQGEPSPMNEPERSREEHQDRYEGTPGPHGQATPSPSNEPQHTQERHQYEGTPGPHGQATPSPSNEPQHTQERHQYEGTPGPHGEATPSPSNEPQHTQERHQYEGTPGPNGEGTASPAGAPQRFREEHEQRNEGTPDPQQQSPADEPQRSREEHEQRNEGTPDPQQDQSPTGEPQPSQKESEGGNEGTPGSRQDQSAPPDPAMPTGSPEPGGPSGKAN